MMKRVTDVAAQAVNYVLKLVVTKQVKEAAMQAVMKPVKEGVTRGTGQGTGGVCDLRTTIRDLRQ